MIPGNKDTRDGILFSIPFLLVFATFLIFPIIFGFIVSFYDYNAFLARTWVGLKNYITIFSDETFYSSLKNTLVFVLLSTPFLLVIGFFMALIVTSKLKIRSAAENMFFLPYMLSMTVVGTLWAWIFQKSYGVLNHLLEFVGLPIISWLTEPMPAMWSVIIATIWWTAGFNMVLMSAGIKQISADVYEAALIDGANNFQKTIYVTLPLLRPTLSLCLILQIIASFNVFGQVYVMTGGGPYGSTQVLVQYIYESGFRYFKMGYSSAMAYILFFIVVVISIVLNKLLKEDK